MRLGERIRATLALDPAATAVEFGARRLSWGDLDAIVDGADRLLRECGIGAGAPIGLLLRNQPEMIGAILAMLASDRCIVCVSPLQGTAKLAEDVRGLHLPALIACEEDWRPEVVRATAAAGTLGISLPETGSAGAPVARVPGLASVGTGRHRHREPMPGVAVEMLTSGTTGPPKRIPLRADALECAIAGASHYESQRSSTPALKRSFAIVVSPLVHIGGIFHSVKAALDGRPMCLLQRFDVDAWRDAVRRHRPRAASLVPSALKMVLDADVPAEDLQSLRAVTSGTAPLAPELQTAFEERYGIPVLANYGATEFAGAVAGWTLADHRAFGAKKRGSVGRAHPGCELRIVDPDTGEPLAPGETGLLEVRTEQAPTRCWLRTADRARVDGDGFLFIEGRADGAINRGGFKIDPAGVARVLERHPAIREAAVVGLPDERLGEVPVAVLELAAGAAAPKEEELLAFAREHLTRYHVPARFKVVEKIPRTPSLKPATPAVRALFEAESS